MTVVTLKADIHVLRNDEKEVEEAYYCANDTVDLNKAQLAAVKAVAKERGIESPYVEGDQSLREEVGPRPDSPSHPDNAKKADKANA